MEKIFIIECFNSKNEHKGTMYEAFKSLEEAKRKCNAYRECQEDSDKEYDDDPWEFRVKALYLF